MLEGVQRDPQLVPQTDSEGDGHGVGLAWTPSVSLAHCALTVRIFQSLVYLQSSTPTLVGPKIDFGSIAQNGLKNGFPYLQGIGNHVVSSDPSLPKPFSSQRLLSPDPHGSLQEGVQRDL